MDRLLDPAVASQHAAALAQMLGSRLTVTADGTPLTAQWTPGLEVLADRQSLKLTLRFPTRGIARPPESCRGDVPVRPAASDLREHLRRRGADAGDPRRRPREVRVLRRHAPGRVRGRQAVPAGGHPPHPDRTGSPAVPRRPAAARRLAAPARDHRHRVHGRAQHHALARGAEPVIPPARIIEPAIALSIVYVGADNLLIRDGRDVRAWIAFAFGFIHGFGFANVLREMDLPRARARLVAVLVQPRRRGRSTAGRRWSSPPRSLRCAPRSEQAGRQLAFAGSVVVIAAGAFWFIQRVFFPGGIS